MITHISAGFGSDCQLISAFSPPIRPAETTYGTMGGMRKTTVYLPDQLKGRLERVAADSGRSEADLIREGIELVSGRAGATEPRLPLFKSGKPDLAERAEEHLAGFGER
jgi:Arc/MetJ-type ribon-helix-helix transcriptional regulator